MKCINCSSQTRTTLLPSRRPRRSSCWTRKFIYSSNLLKLTIFHQITQENPGSRNI
uniref:Uncharacterized protein n=1 Tax=Ailuropoda melanoleuca TaxID=9646 RepID=A0A7N5JW07_AILME